MDTALRQDYSRFRDFFIIAQGREDGWIFLPTLSVPGVVPTLRAQYAWGANFFRDGSALKIS